MNSLRKIQAAHCARHLNVGKDNADIRMFIQYLKGLSGVSSFPNDQAHIGYRISSHHSRREFILDNQNFRRLSLFHNS